MQPPLKQDTVTIL